MSESAEAIASPAPPAESKPRNRRRNRKKKRKKKNKKSTAVDASKGMEVWNSHQQLAAAAFGGELLSPQEAGRIAAAKQRCVPTSPGLY